MHDKKIPKSRVTRLDPVIGDNVRRLREGRGWTQPILADRMEVSLSLLSQLETGHKPWNSSTIVAACDALGVDAVHLFGGAMLTAQEAKSLTLIRALHEAETKEREYAQQLGLKPSEKKPDA